MTQNTKHAIQAYKSAARYRSDKQQEADVFHYATAGLKAAEDAGPIQRTRATADNRRLWTMVGDLLRDPANTLPDALKASIISIGLTVQREMDQEKPDFRFLMSINDEVAAGLAGSP